MCARRAVRLADAASVDDDQMRKLAPALRIEICAKFGFNLHRIIRIGDSEKICDAFDMGVDREPGNTEGVAEHDVGGFASDAGERSELLHGIRHFAAEIGDDALACADDVCSFCAVIAAAADDGFEFRRIRLRIILRGVILREKIKGHAVHHLVGALRGENRCDEELKGRCVFERADLGAVLCFEQVVDEIDLFPFFHFPASSLRKTRRSSSGEVIAVPTLPTTIPAAWFAISAASCSSAPAARQSV